MNIKTSCCKILELKKTSNLISMIVDSQDKPSDCLTYSLSRLETISAYWVNESEASMYA